MIRWSTIFKQVIMTNAHLIWQVIPPISLQLFKIDVYICLPCHSIMAAIRKRSSAASDAPATRKKGMEQLEPLEPANICTYWPTTLHSIQRGCCFVARFSLMRTGQSTCLLVSTLLATIYLWWNLVLSVEAVDPKPSFSAMNNWTQWRRLCKCYGTPCVVAKRLLGSQVREWCIWAGCNPQSTYGSSIRRIAIHFPNFIRYLLSIAHVYFCATAIARLHRSTTRRVAICYGYFNFVTYVKPPPDADKN